MKRVIILALALILLLPTLALADQMVVVNCNEWVSLRERPNTASKRLIKVPLYDIVRDCTWVENGFVRCTYQDLTGYIQDKYLEPMEPDEAETLLDEVLTRYGMNIFAVRTFNEGERLVVTGYASNGAELWSYGTEVNYITELPFTDAFIGGTAEDPRVLVYNSDVGLTSLDLTTGRVVWSRDVDALDLGSGICHAVDGDGTMYIAGYYGPDPVCVDIDGQVRWQASPGDDDIIWPYQIDIEGDAIVTHYEGLGGDTGVGCRVRYDRSDGHVIAMEADD